MGSRRSKSIVFSTQSLPLPCDIIVNHIFVKLPLLSLLSCKCVCKEWLRLLTHSYFIHLHHKHQKNNSIHKQLLLGKIFYREGLPGDTKQDYEAKSSALHGALYSIHVHSSQPAGGDAVRLRGFSLDLEDYLIVRMLGCCNGLVSFLVSNLLEKGRATKLILIGNPSTGDYKILPKVSYPRLVGFGYVSSLDDYKFVVIDRHTRHPHIFSLKLNSWRTNSNVSDSGRIKSRWFIFEFNAGIALDTSIYWLVESNRIIVEFNLIDEEFTEFPLPFDMGKDELSYMTTVGGSLCVVNESHENYQVDLWFMLKHQGNNEKKEMSYHWCMLMTVDLSDFGYVRLQPLSFMENDKLLCRLHLGYEEDSFALIDPKTNKVENFTIRDEAGGDLLQQVTFQDQHMGYIDSLVSPN